MKEVTGDFWKLAKDYNTLVCTINLVVKANGELVMGAGIALEFAKNFPFLPQDFGQKIKANIAKPNYNLNTIITSSDFNEVTDEDYLILGIPTKIHWQDKSSLFFIEQSLYCLAETVNERAKVLMTRPGCGNGGLKWEEVRPLCEKYLDHRFTICEKEVK